jgi:hypothetical protein
VKKLLGILVLGLLWCNVGFAGTPDLKTSSPVIYLANNLDEEENRRKLWKIIVVAGIISSVSGKQRLTTVDIGSQ